VGRAGTAVLRRLSIFSRRAGLCSATESWHSWDGRNASGLDPSGYPPRLEGDRVDVWHVQRHACTCRTWRGLRLSKLVTSVWCPEGYMKKCGLQNLYLCMPL